MDYPRNQSSAVPVPPNSTDNQKFTVVEILDKSNFAGFYWNLQDEHLQHHYFSAELLRLWNEGVFKYNTVKVLKNVTMLLSLKFTHSNKHFTIADNPEFWMNDY